MRRLTRSKKNMLRRRAARRRRMVPVVAFILLLSLVLQTFAFTPNTNKEEVIYVNLKLDGSVDAIYVVNSFDLSKDGKIIDYGDYTSFRQLTESGEIKMEKETISIDASAGKIYYEGKLKNESIPWAFNINYFLNGKEYKGQDLAGKSGNLKINIDVGENPNYSGVAGKGEENVFFKNLTLQLGLIFDASKTKDLVAEGGVIANAGKNKQIMFTVLPGRKSSFEVSAQVTSFEMEGITINGVPMSIDFDIEDDPEMTKEMKKLTDGVAELDDGARELRDGVKDLRDGTEELKDGVEELNDGVIELADGSKELRENTDEFVDGVEELNDGVIKLRRGSRDLKDGIVELVDGLGGLTSSVGAMRDGASGLAGGLNQMAVSGQALARGAEQIVDLAFDAATAGTSLAGINVGTYKLILGQAISEIQSGIFDYIEFVSGYAIRMMIASEMGIHDLSTANATQQAIISSAAIGKIKELAGEQMMTRPEYLQITSLMAIGMFYDGVVDYTNGVAFFASKVGELAGGISQLYTGLGQIDRAKLREGVLELYDGVVDLRDGTGKLLNGAIELKDGIIELDDGVIELKDGVLELFDGAIELHDGVIELYDGTIKMAEGTMEFKDKTADLEKTLKDKIKEKIDEMLGAAFKVQSFVSEKNTNIDSVQFVMKTADIVMEEVEEAPAEPPKPLSFFDRLLALFTFLTP